MKGVKLLFWTKTPSAEMLAQQELEEARRELLEAQSAAEYTKAMVAYHTNRIQRLSNFLKEPKP